MQNKILSRLLKSKAAQKADIDALIENYCDSLAQAAKSQIESLCADIFVFVCGAKLAEKPIADKDIMRIVEIKLNSFSFNADLTPLTDFYMRCRETARAERKDIKKAAFSFNIQDLSAIETLHSQFVSALKDHSNETQEKIKGVVEQAVKGNISVDEMAKQLGEKLTNIVDKEPSYFKTLGSTILSRTENIAKLNDYIEWGVDKVEVLAVIDHKTSQICRSMNGRIIDISHLRNQRDRILNATSYREAIKASDLTFKGALVGAKLPENIGIPPYHFNCRTTIVPYSFSDGDVISAYSPGDKITIDGKEKEVIREHVDSTGYKRIITQNTFNHKSRSKKPSEDKMVKAMNSIVEIGEQNNGRLIARCQNDMILVYNGSEVCTAFQRKNGREAAGYFKDHAVKNIVKIQKTVLRKWLENLLSK
jgi:hypothetical protein